MGQYICKKYTNILIPHYHNGTINKRVIKKLGVCSHWKDISINKYEFARREQEPEQFRQSQ